MKEIEQMKEHIDKMNAGEANERTSRRRKAMENETREKFKGPCSPFLFKLNGWVDWCNEMETLMDSADVRKMLSVILESLPKRRRDVIDEEITYSDLNGRVHHMKIVI